MALIRTRPSRSIDVRPSRVAVAFGMTATSLLVIGIGVALPWLTVFRGLSPVAGFTLEGGPLAGLALGAGGLLATSILIGGGRLLRPLAAAIAVFVAVDAVLVAARIAAFVADPGPAAALTQPTGGIGAPLTAVGGFLLTLAALATPANGEGLERRRWTWIALALSLLVTGWIHLLLTPEHIVEAPALGVGFLIAGLTQIGLATVAMFRPSPWVALATAAVNATLVAVYAFAVVVGLPFFVGHDVTGLVVGTGEPIDLAGAASMGAEVMGVILAIALLPGPPEAVVETSTDRGQGWSTQSR